MNEKTYACLYKAISRPDNRFDLVIFVGHNALMDQDISLPSLPTDLKARNKKHSIKAAVIACKSKQYFTDPLTKLGAEPYVMTRGLMAPEAYVIEGVLNAWVKGKDASHARRLAAQKYAAYQKIPLKNANWLFGVV